MNCETTCWTPQMAYGTVSETVPCGITIYKTKGTEKMKKTTLFAALVASTMLPIAVNADTITTNGVTWTYTVNDATAKTVTLGNGSAACIATGTSVDAANIPWTFDIDGETYTVTALANNAFKSCSKLSGTLTIPDAVTSMGQQAFYGCPKLSRLTSLGGIIPTCPTSRPSARTHFTG